MAKEWYREINFRAKSLRMINWLNKIIAEEEVDKKAVREMARAYAEKEKKAKEKR